jgi:hypothetical protein
MAGNWNCGLQTGSGAIVVLFPSGVRTRLAMAEIFKNVESLVAHFKDYVEIRIEQARLEVADKGSRAFAAVITTIILFLIVFLIVLFASMSLAFVLGEIWDQMWLGFLAVSGFYVFMALFVYLMREKMIRIPMINSILKQMTIKAKDEDL